MTSYGSSITSTPSDKSLTSFPSLSPTNSPTDIRHATLAGNIVEESLSPTPRKSSKSTPTIVDSLTAATPSMRSRSALFDDSPTNGLHIPGALHHTSDEHIERLIARNGAVALVRQMAQDVAQRDAQMTVLRRRTELRERTLRKMLLECEVSNMDIEMRLRSSESPEGDNHSTGSGKALDQGLGGHLETDKSTEGSINEMMTQAMRDTVGLDDDDNGITSTFSTRELPSNRAAGMADAEVRSIASRSSYDKKPTGTTRGWKEYLWLGTGTSKKSSRASSINADQSDAESTTKLRASSVTGARRRVLQHDLFQPPDDGETRDLDGELQAAIKNRKDGTDLDAHSRKSSSSVASWAVKLVAGAPQSSRDNDLSKTTRVRAATDSNNLRQKNMSTASAASAALAKVNGKVNDGSTRRDGRSVTMSGSNTVKALPKSASLPQPNNGPQSPASLNDTNLGPVEMDTIFPENTRPPTLTAVHNQQTSAEYLTDRFGFIYDQRRKKRQRDAAEGRHATTSGAFHVEMLTHTKTDKDVNVSKGAAASEPSDSLLNTLEPRPVTPASVDEGEESKPRKWQDYLKTATHPTELLSHTPSSTAIPTLSKTSGELSPNPLTVVTDRVSGAGAILPPKLSATSIVSDNAMLAERLPSASSPPSTPVEQREPVKLLLDQLTEVHDSLQREKTTKWNEFLRKVRAERRREDEAAPPVEGRLTRSTMPEISLADGEMIGVAGLGNKGKVGRAKWNEFKSLVLGGIPVSYRAKIWAECSGASSMRIPGYYDDLIRDGVDDPVIVAQIGMDINRTLTDNIFFRKGPGVHKLNEVLIAYARRNPEVGYCQGMNQITASLLLIMPTPEDAFWVLTSMVENILPAHYYDHALLASRADQQVLRQYVSSILPKLSGHLDQLRIELEALTFQWFLSVFTDCLSAEALFRVWDVVLCTNDGSTFLFQVALALLKLNEAHLMECKTSAEVYSYINHQMTNHAISIDGLIQASDALKKVVKREEVDEYRRKAVEKEEEVMRARASLRKNT
ncbi:MAG: hypothetical protein M1824_003496 [Vezdaea acicularis]|nr:MAG: hypothetical protein M1824_003496 [Vezdaea acicularis]